MKQEMIFALNVMDQQLQNGYTFGSKSVLIIVLSACMRHIPTLQSMDQKFLLVISVKAHAKHAIKIRQIVLLV